VRPGSGEAVVRQERHGDVAVLVLAHPPVNALSNALRAGLDAALAATIADPSVRAIVLRGEGRGFCAGADISEFGAPRTALRLGDLCRTIEASPKPVIAAIHGMALGGGLELALAAHYRLAGEGAVLGLPEVNLGLLPGAGGTQRLPRLLGAKEALRLMLSGVPMPAPEAARLGLVDRLVEGNLTETAIAFAAGRPPPRPTGARRDGMADARAYLAAVAEARAAQAGNRLPAPGRIVDLVEAALLFPLDRGLVTEETAFAELLATPEAAALRHAFFAERRAQQLPAALAAAKLPDLASLGLWGSGGGEVADLACQALAAGLRVVLAAPDRDALVALVSAVAQRQEADVTAGRMTPEARDADWARLLTATGPEALSGADLVLTADGAPDLPAAQARRLTVAPLGAAGPGAAVAITAAPGVAGLAELGLGPEARSGVALALVALARRLNWRLVPVGPGGPVELGLRLALGAALAHLASQGIAAPLVSEALARWLRPRPAPPGAGLTPAIERHVIDTCLLALAAEGARMLQDGRAPRPATLDAIAMLAGLVPRWAGGPMFQADQRGLLVLRRDLRALAEAEPVFQPCDLLDRLLADGQRLSSLN
jgi:3-hydroxyacyl-CoA dehydrogenase